LYDQYHFDEAWDGPNNRKLIERMPDVYRDPSAPAGSSDASYFVLTGPDTPFTDHRGSAVSTIRDGTSNTFLVVEAKRDIPWTRPDDIPFDRNGPLPQLGGHRSGDFSAAFADGSVRVFPDKIDPERVRAMITASGGEVIQP